MRRNVARWVYSSLVMGFDLPCAPLAVRGSLFGQGGSDLHVVVAFALPLVCMLLREVPGTDSAALVLLCGEQAGQRDQHSELGLLECGRELRDDLECSPQPGACSFR